MAVVCRIPCIGTQFLCKCVAQGGKTAHETIEVGNYEVIWEQVVYM